MVPLLRQTGAHSWDTIWGEDGWVYFQQAHDHGLGVVLRGYAGYLQLTPRLLAIPTAIVPIHQLALYFAVVAAVVGAALAWFVYWASEGWVESRPVRLALASLVVLMPALGYENTANVTNTIWILFGGDPVGAGGAPESRRPRCGCEAWWLSPRPRPPRSAPSSCPWPWATPWCGAAARPGPSAEPSAPGWCCSTRWCRTPATPDPAPPSASSGPCPRSSG